MTVVFLWNDQPHWLWLLLSTWLGDQFLIFGWRLREPHWNEYRSCSRQVFNRHVKSGRAAVTILSFEDNSINSRRPEQKRRNGASQADDLCCQIALTYLLLSLSLFSVVL
jgi:hypothetical protein